jgi:hypothetical protein
MSLFFLLSFIVVWLFPNLNYNRFERLCAIYTAAASYVIVTLSWLKLLEEMLVFNILLLIVESPLIPTVGISYGHILPQLSLIS